MPKKFILNANDLGKSEACNRAVLEGYQYGMLKSASILANGEMFNDAVNNVVKNCPDLGIGVHLNITEEKSISNDLNKLTDENGNFNNSFLKLLIKSYNFKDKTFINQLEKEFRAQIEKVKNSGIQITHLDSHSNIHTIPIIFNLVCKLANEYGINYVCTHFEKFYAIPEVFIHLNKKYPVNLIKMFFLNLFSTINYSTVQKYGLNTNDYLIGILYNSMMTPLTVSYGVRVLKNYNNITAEAVIHPSRYEDGTINNNFTEYILTKNEKLKNKIEDIGFEIGNYRN